MNILVLNGSPRLNGNTSRMVNAFREGAELAGHHVDCFHVARQKIAGCLACEYCHTKGNGACIQQDGMAEIYERLKQADMLVLASPIYYHGFTGQLQCAINRIYAIGKPENLPRLKQAALLLSSGDPDVYGGALYAYENSFLGFLKLRNMGIFTSAGEEDNHTDAELLEKLRAFGAGLYEEIRVAE